jgi:ankyrin repeat protein
MSQPKKGKLSLLKSSIKIFAIGLIGLALLGWAEAQIISKQTNNTEKYGYQIVELLSSKTTIDNPNEWGETSLYLAIKAKDKQLVEILLSKGASATSITNTKATPLHYAASFADEEIIKLLISKGANINAADNSNEKPVDWAIRTKQKDNAQLLKSLVPQNITHFQR